MVELRVRVRTLVLVGSIAVATLVAGTAIGATLVKNGKAVTAVRTVTADNFVATSSLGFTDMPNMALSVPVPAGEQALLVITFSASTRCPADSVPEKGECVIQVLVDGSASPPGDVLFASGKDSDDPIYGYSAQSMQFVSGPLSSGTHTVKVRFKKTGDVLGFWVADRSLTVLRSKV